jgi:hypothetical protein
MLAATRRRRQQAASTSVACNALPGSGTPMMLLIVPV